MFTGAGGGGGGGASGSPILHARLLHTILALYEASKEGGGDQTPRTFRHLILLM